MSRPQEIAADARALYGPLDQRPSAQEAGDGALWVDPESGPALYVVRSGNWGRVGLAQRGAHDAAGGYGPGDLVTAGGGLYVCTAPVAAGDARVDSFQRPDQEGWGTASDGHVWALSYDAGGDSSVVSHTGVEVATVSNSTSNWLLGAALDAADCEVLVRWTATVAPSNSRYAEIILRSSADGNEGAYLNLLASGTGAGEVYDALYVVGSESESDSPTPDTSFTRPAGVAYWTRARVVGQTYSWRTWADGDAEPGSWDRAFTAAVDLTGQTLVGLTSALDRGDSIAFDHFSAITLAPAPAADPAHWTALAVDPVATGAVQTTAPASGDGDALPATPAGYVQVTIDGAPALLPYYRPAP